MVHVTTRGLRPLPTVTRGLRLQANGHLQVLVRIGRSKVTKYMTLASKVESPPNPDDALAPRNPDEDLVPDMSMALAAARRAIALASVDSVRDVPITFEK